MKSKPALPPRPGNTPDPAAEAAEGAKLPPRPAAAGTAEGRGVPSRPGKEKKSKPAAPAPIPTRPAAPAETAAPTTTPQRDPRPANAPVAEGSEDVAPSGGMLDEIKSWMGASGGSYLASMLFHTALFLLLALILGVRYVVQQINSAPTFDAPEVTEVETSEFKPFDLTVPADVDPSEIDLEHTLQQGNEKSTKLEGPPMDQDAKFYDNTDKFEEAGGGLKTADANAPQLGGGGLDFASVRSGPSAKGAGGLGSGVGTGENPGSGGSGSGFGGRGSGHREAMVARYGGTKATERAVAAALNWLARHQNRDGSWDQTFPTHCTGAKCSGPGNPQGAGTAFGILPFLAAGQTHMTKGMYQNTVRGGLYWLIAHQNQKTGDLRMGAKMYTHGLSTIALCEAYGMTKDSRIGYAAQAAINYIQSVQDPKTGGWGYDGPGTDTSIVGWQVMSLKSGQMAGLQVKQAALDGARKHLAAVSGSDYGATFAYGPGGGKTPRMTGVGLLCRQYLGANREDPGLTEGTQFLMANKPAAGAKDIYLWYYATQVMHNMMGDQWDNWNRNMRRTMVDAQARQGCETGSWDPAGDPFGDAGGRLMTTSMSCLCLEIYYRYQPLFDINNRGKNKGAGPALEKEDKPEK